MEELAMTYTPLRRILASIHLYTVSVPISIMVITLVTFLAACGGSTPQTQTQSKYGGNISVGLNADVVTLDPLKSSALVDRQVMLNLYDTLVSVNEQNQLVPDLATSWS